MRCEFRDGRILLAVVYIREIPSLVSIPLAAVLSSVSFTLHHIVVLFVYIPDLAMVALFNLGVFTGGLIWAGLYQRFSSFWAIWLSHLIVDVGIMMIVYKILFPLI